MEIFCFIVGAIIIGSLIKGSSDNKGSTSGRGTTSPPPLPAMGRFELRTNRNSNWRGKGLDVITFEVRGLMPVARSMQIDFVTWLEDVTDDSGGEPVFCAVESLQHHDSPCFECVRDGGDLAPNQGFKDWVEIGVAPVDSLTFPKSGMRLLKARCYVSEKTSPKLRQSLVGAHSVFHFNNADVGYKEWETKRLEALKMSLRLGVAIAFADDNFDDAEGRAIKAWIRKRIERLPDDEQANAKKELNEALVAAFAEARAGRLSVDQAATILKKSPIKHASYDALELCTVVMAADGVMHPAELRTIDRIGRLLDIDNDAIRSLRDKHAPAAQNSPSGQQAVTDEMLVGLEAGLTPEQTRKKLRELFGRYNAMMQIEKDRDKRARYQSMLDAIARLTAKHR